MIYCAVSLLDLPSFSRLNSRSIFNVLLIQYYVFLPYSDYLPWQFHTAEVLWFLFLCTLVLIGELKLGSLTQVCSHLPSSLQIYIYITYLLFSRFIHYILVPLHILTEEKQYSCNYSGIVEQCCSQNNLLIYISLFSLSFLLSFQSLHLIVPSLHDHLCGLDLL